MKLAKEEQEQLTKLGITLERLLEIESLAKSLFSKNLAPADLFIAAGDLNDPTEKALLHFILGILTGISYSASQVVESKVVQSGVPHIGDFGQA